MKEINEKRKGEKYSDEDAATIVHGSPYKPPLKESPFVRELQYGQNKDGYWNYEQMMTQLEDCVDALQTMYPEFDHVFLFNHSNGHDRLQPDGLSINKIGIRFGGTQPMMRSSKITKDLLGPFHTPISKLQPGMEQMMQFSINDKGPCNLSPKKD